MNYADMDMKKLQRFLFLLNKHSAAYDSYQYRDEDYVANLIIMRDEIKKEIKARLS